MGNVEFWSTDQVPEAVRFTAWSEKMRALHLDWNLTTSVGEAYAARIRYRSAGNTRITDGRFSAFSGRRDPSTDTADVVGIQLNLSGRMVCRHGDNQFAVGPGDLFVWASDGAATFDSSGEHRQLSFIVPRSRAPRSLDAWLDQSRAVAAGPGAGLVSVAADQIRGIVRELGRLTDHGVDRAVDSLLDLLGAAVAPAHTISRGQRSALLSDLQRYILERLDDRGLSAGSIAAAHGISVRTLHLVFSEGGASVSRWTRQQRLERCRRELTRATGNTTVTDVAFRWGFSDAAHFSRAFKQTFGVTPSSVRPRQRPERISA